MTETARGRWSRSLLGERDVSVWALLGIVLGPPVAWSLHFLLGYFLVALYCSAGWSGGKAAIAIATVPFLAASAAAGIGGWRAWRRHHAEQRFTEAAAGSPDWLTFLLVMGIVGSVLFSALIAAEAAPVLFAPLCAEVVA